MAQPIALDIPPRNPRAELRSRLEQAPTKCSSSCTSAACWRSCAAA
jgi:hypothetical protein